ncbi:hypothetical protein JW964_18435 [candidate division KSB1 bacterium]|nr:hypothetical protein [candidate division KSB1 bacterium]
MSISYSAPLSKAWQRMKEALFRPFDLAKWFVVGFTAFLAGLADGGSGSRWDISDRRHFDLNELREIPQNLKDWYYDYSEWAALIIIGIVAVIALIILIIWLSSRGKFMFLHNVVNNSSEVSRPWHAYKKEGDSLFLWRLVFALVAIGMIAMFAIQFYFVISEYETSTGNLFLSIGGLVLVGLISFIVIGYVSLFLDNFIVPIMYRYRMTTTEAWNYFLPILRQNLLQFILYGLFILALLIGLVIGIIIIGFMTCCVGFILFVIPYVNTVVLLPIIYTFRAFSVEFLAQFGEEFNVFMSSENLSSALPD